MNRTLLLISVVILGVNGCGSAQEPGCDIQCGEGLMCDLSTGACVPDVSFVANNNTNTTLPNSVPGDLPCGAQNVLNSCSRCHSATPKGSVPFSLTKRADLVSLAPNSTDSVAWLSLQAMKAGTMPPRGKLDDATIAAFETWMHQGMPSGTCETNGDTTPMNPTTNTGMGGGNGNVTNMNTGGGSGTMLVCNDTWGDYGQQFFANECISCHTKHAADFGTVEVVKTKASRIRQRIASGSMPKGKTLSADEKTRILNYLDCGVLP